MWAAIGVCLLIEPRKTSGRLQSGGELCLCVCCILRNISLCIDIHPYSDDGNTSISLISQEYRARQYRMEGRKRGGGLERIEVSEVDIWN